MASSSPIRNRIGMVFVPVSDISTSIQWYSRLFNLPVQSTSHGSTIYDLPMEGDAGLILDGTQPDVHPSSQPLCFFWTDDIHRTRDFLRAQAIRVVREVEDIGSVSTITFQDPDGNLLMACQRNR